MDENEVIDRYRAAAADHDVEALIGLLEHGHLTSSIARRLSELGDRRATAPLLRLAGSRSAEDRRTALRFLGALGDPSAIDVLLAHARTDDDVAARTWAIGSVAQLGLPSAVGTLLALLDDPSREVRWSAAAALGDMRVREARPAIRAAMRRDGLGCRGPYGAALRRMWLPRYPSGPIGRGPIYLYRLLRVPLVVWVPWLTLLLYLATRVVPGLEYSGIGGLFLAAVVIELVDTGFALAWSAVSLRGISASPRSDISEQFWSLWPAVALGRAFGVAIAPGLDTHGIPKAILVAAVTLVIDYAVSSTIGLEFRRWARNVRRKPRPRRVTP